MPDNVPSGADMPPRDIDPAALAAVLREVPRGALALAGIAVTLLVLAYFAVYFFVYLPRGSVG